MFGKIFLKEWRENILIFSLAILFMAALIVLNLSNQIELTLYSSSMFLMLFLPISALLIGSGGFYSEFKDNAWIYLFSRPIKKEKIWIFKYISLLSILLAIFLIFFLVRHFLPGLDEILKDIDFPSEFSGLLSLSIYFVVPILAFTISFSISLLYDKQFVIFFVSALIGTGLALLFRKYIEFLWLTYFYTKDFKIFYLFIAVSFIAASILTFIKSDFSQMGKKIFRFSKYVVLFLGLSFFLGTVWITKGKIFSADKGFYHYSSHKHQGDVYLSSFRHGIFRFDSRQDKIEKLSKKSRFSDFGFSVRNGKIAFIEYVKGRKGWQHDLWIMNTDGSDEKALIESHKKESPFHNLYLRSCILSPEGNRVAFITSPESRRSEKKIPILWWMNTDGSGLKSQSLDFLPNRYSPYSSSRLELIAWPALEDYLILSFEEKSSGPISFYKIVKVDLEQGAYQVLVENVLGPYQIWVSPKHNSLALGFRDKLDNKEIIAVLNLKTLEIKEIFKADFLKKLGGIKWDQNGDKIAFVREKELWVYHLAENRAKKIIQWNYNYETRFDWASDGHKFVLIEPFYGEGHLTVLGEDFSEEKIIKIPFPIKGSVYVWGLDNKVLVKDYRRGPLWRVDLETEEWKKIN